MSETSLPFGLIADGHGFPVHSPLGGLQGGALEASARLPPYTSAGATFRTIKRDEQSIPAGRFVHQHGLIRSLLLATVGFT